MKEVDLKKELERVGLERKHAEEAFAWLRENGDIGDNNIWYHELYQAKGDWIVMDAKGNKYYSRRTSLLAYFFACKEKGELNEDPPFEKEVQSNKIVQVIYGDNSDQIWEKLEIKKVRNDESDETSGISVIENESDKSGEIMIAKASKLLEQFYQIIFYGPPGTGKTHHAKGVLKKIFKSDEGSLLELQKNGRWDIVQFHPSYNYEDFVRGIKVETNKEGKVNYKTEDRIFGEICKLADEEYKEALNKNRKPKRYALIIDEINRANVSAVLGELIYALEYRGELVKTPYKVDGKQEIIIPKNLYIIGTMNTADRTIGQIDYAVRRRFAFVSCFPSREIVEKNINDNDVLRNEVLKIYDDVQKLFGRDSSSDNESDSGYLSQDYYAVDVRIGHSYFLADDEKEIDGKIIPAREQIALKILYQVVPILREYVKDGVLREEANDKITKIEERAEELLQEPAKKLPADKVENSDSSAKNSTKSKKTYEGHFPVLCKKGDHLGFESLGDAVLTIIKDYTNQNSLKSIEELQENFSLSEKSLKVFSKEDKLTHSHFVQEKDQIPLLDGSRAVVSFGWSPEWKSWKEFKARAESQGYRIHNCRFVNIGEDQRRSWNDCYKYNFVAAGGGKHQQSYMEKIEIGDPIFAYWGGKGVRVRKEKGFIAFGYAMDKVIPIDKFRTTDNHLLSECLVGSGKTYKEEYPEAFQENNLCDYAVRVQWKKVLPKVIPIDWTQHIVKERISIEYFKQLREAFNLSHWDK